AGDVVGGDLLDRLLVLLRELVPLVLVHEEAERRAVHAAREQRRLREDRVELEGDDRLERKEDAVGYARAQQLVRFGCGLDERRGAERLRDLLRDAATPP